MILLLHALCIVTRYILTVISRSVFSKAEDVSGEQETNSYFIFNDSNITCEAEFEPSVGIRFFPPVYIQRYLAVKKILQDERWCGEIKKVVDFGCAEFGLFPIIKHIPGLQELMTVDIDRELLQHYCCRAAPLNADYLDNRQQPLTVHVFAGSIADRDPRLLGTDAVICIELIEHLYPDTLEAVPHTVFGFIQPLISIFTTPNSDFNVLFPNVTGFRHPDHKFEWSRGQFEDWATNITTRYPAYTVKFFGIGQGPKGTKVHGCCSQMAVFIKLSHYTPHLATQHPDLEVEECEETYVLVRKYEYPFYIDNRTDEEKILHAAEYYIRLLASNEKYCNDMSISIPLQHLLPHVDMCDSASKLRNILEDGGWQVIGQMQDDEAVLYPYCGEYESSAHESEDLYCEEQGEGVGCQQVQLAGYREENWDVLETASCHEYGDSATSHFVDGVGDWPCDIIEPQYDMQLEWVVDTVLQDVTVNSSDSCKTMKDELVECSECVRNIKSVESVPVSCHLGRKNAEEVMQSTLQHSDGFSAYLNSKDDSDIRTLADLQPEFSAEQIYTPFVGHNVSEEGFEFSEIIQNCRSVNAVSVESSKNIDFQKCCNSEALTDHKSEKYKKAGANLGPYSDSSKIIGKLQNSQHIEHQASQLKSSNVNVSGYCSGSNRNTKKLINVCQVIQAGESLSDELLSLHLKREKTDGSTSQAVISQPVNFGSANSSVQESSQERSLVESCSVDEQNEKAVDSGYPNSFSVQDMDMDLTPEQVDEISTESDENLTGDSGDSEYYESESSEEREHIDNNDGLLFPYHHHQALFDPMIVVVENGDVANNNRDGEGNNAVAIIQPPQEPVEEALHPVNDFIPLLAAAEDFDNDNDIILPGDDEPFPHWLLHLLRLANPGGGDIQNYVVLPAGDGGFILPDEGVGDVDDDIDAPSSSSSEIGDIERVLNDLDNNELVVMGDIGGGCM